MGEKPSAESKSQTDPPAPEVLVPRTDNDATQVAADSNAAGSAGTKLGKRPRRGTYRPSHRATFIGLAVVVAVLAVNAAIIAFVIKGQSDPKSSVSQNEVIISQDVLDKLGVNRSSVGSLGIELVVGPDARFNKKVTVGGELTVSGQLKLNNKLSVADADVTKLQAGDASLSQLNVNGNGTVGTLNLRNELLVAGQTKLQGAVTMSQLLTVNNSANIIGNLAVGGVLSANAFQTSNLVVDGTLMIGGHVITRGSAPGVSGGSALGSNGTVSISGNDASGTVGVNIGVGATAGTVANVTFRQKYSSTPHVVITPVGGNVGSFYVNRSSTGFSIVVGAGLAPGGYAFDYIVQQ